MSLNDFQFIQGDCLVELKNLPDNSVDMVMADPPYQQNYNYGWDDDGIDLDKLWVELKRIVKEDGVIAMTAQQPFTSKLVLSNLEWFRYEWIWDKQIPKGMHQAKFQPMRRHESVIIFCDKYKGNYYPIKTPREKPVKSFNITKNNKGGIGPYLDNDKKIFTYTDKNPVSIITGHFEANRGTVRYHPTQKPVSLMEYLVKTYTLEEDVVLDFCYGSCATGVACKNSNRNFIGIELDENYYEMGKERVLNS